MLNSNLSMAVFKFKGRAYLVIHSFILFTRLFLFISIEIFLRNDPSSDNIGEKTN